MTKSGKSRAAPATGPAATLAALREEIDAVDAELHDLLMRRAELATGMGALKAASGEDGGAAIRPAREAAILRRLAARHRPGLPFAVVVRVWRELMAANLRRQGMFQVAVADGGGSGFELWDLARTAFGTLTPMTAHADPAAALADVDRRRGTVAVLPDPAAAGGPARCWPEHLNRPGAPRVIARLPMAEENGLGGLAAYVAGHAPLEPSGADFTLALIVTPSPRPDLLAQAGLPGRIDATWPAMSSAGLAALAVLDGFIEPSGPELLTLSQAARDGSVTVIGACPASIAPPRKDGP